MNTVRKSLEDLSTKGIESWGKTDQDYNGGSKGILTLPLLSKVNLHKREILKLLPERTDIFPLSHGQRALWFLYQSTPESAPYHVALTLRIHSKVDVSALQGAFQELIDRHPSLRTTFSVHNGELVQEVHRHQEVCFEGIDASGITWKQLNNRVKMAYKTPFNLKRGPLIRVILFSRSEKEHILLVTVHHIVFDAWSLLILLDELRILYSAQKADASAFLMPPDKSYADYVQWQAEMLSSSKGEGLWSFWRETLAGELPILDLPTDRPRSIVQRLRGATYSFELDEELTEKVKILSRTEGKTIYMTLLTAFYVLLFHHTGQEDILVGSMATGRSQPEFARTVGYFMNPVALRQDLSSDPTFKMFLDQVHQTVVEALRHQDYPFSLLAERLHPNHDFSRSPLFQVMFNIPQLGELEDMLTPGRNRSRMEWDDLDLDLYHIPRQEVQFDLTLEMMKKGRTLQGAFKYNADLFDKTTIARMARQFHMLIKRIMAAPLQRLSELSLY